MKATRIKRWGLVVLLLVVLPFGMMSWKVYCDDWQHKLDRGLIAAARRNDSGVVSVMLSEGADPNARNLPPDTRSMGRRIWDRLRGRSLPGSHAPTALLVALAVAAYGHGEEPPQNFAVVKALVEAGGAVNVADEVGTTPLMLAAMQSKRETTDLLLARGADVSARDQGGLTALHRAIASGEISQIELLLSRGAPVNVGDMGKQTPLHWAALIGEAAEVRLLCEKGADVNARDIYDSTPLAFAAGNDQADSVQILLAHGAQVNSTDKNNQTPLMQAQQSHNTQIVNILRKAGATE